VTFRGPFGGRGTNNGVAKNGDDNTDDIVIIVIGTALYMKRDHPSGKKGDVHFFHV